MPGFYDGQHDSNSRIRHPNTSAAGPSSAPPNQTHFDAYGNQNQTPIGDEKFPNPQGQHPSQNKPYRHPTDDSEDFAQGNQSQQFSQRTPSNPYPTGMGGDELNQQQSRKGVLQKSRRFADAYDEQGANKGSSGSSKKVMDFFRRMGRQRNEGR
jgi:protein-serine/threonine kinase